MPLPNPFKTGVTDADLKFTGFEVKVFSHLPISMEDQKDKDKDKLRFNQSSLILLGLGENPKPLLRRLLKAGSYYEFDEWSKAFRGFSGRIYGNTKSSWEVRQWGVIEKDSPNPLIVEGRSYTNVNVYEMYGPEKDLRDQHLYTFLDKTILADFTVRLLHNKYPFIGYEVRCIWHLVRDRKSLDHIKQRVTELAGESVQKVGTKEAVWFGSFSMRQHIGQTIVKTDEYLEPEKEWYEVVILKAMDEIQGGSGSSSLIECLVYNVRRDFSGVTSLPDLLRL